MPCSSRAPRLRQDTHRSETSRGGAQSQRTGVARRKNTPQVKDRTTTAGFLFESAVLHDLQVFAEALRGEVRQYHDSYGNEMDAVIVLPDGNWVAVEVKLSGNAIQQAQKSLDKAIVQIDHEAVGSPLLRLIITGTGPTATIGQDTVTCPLSKLGA